MPGEHLITRDAKRRIEVLRELVEVGGGFKLAMHDLELRGAGNLLGREQSGEITAVGFELYTEMMEQAIRELRGEPERPDFEPELQLGIPAYIPDSLRAGRERAPDSVPADGAGRVGRGFRRPARRVARPLRAGADPGREPAGRR